MGINIGAFLSPLVCGWLAQHDHFKEMLEGWGMDPTGSWHWGFGAAAVGMALGLIQYVLGGKYLHERSTRPAPCEPHEYAAAKQKLKIGLVCTLVLVGLLYLVHTQGWYELNETRISTGFGVLLGLVCAAFFGWLFKSGSWTPAERKNLIVIFVLFCGSSVFWSCFEQAGSTLNLFAEESTDNQVLGHEYPASWFQSLNALFIIALAPVFAWMWVALKDRDPSSPAKFSLGILLVGAGFAVLSVGAAFARNGVLVSPWWLFFTYLLHTVGELCLSPVGLSAMTKLAPQRVVGLMMGVWFLSTSVGNWLGGTIARFYGDTSGEAAEAGEAAAGADPSTMFAYIAGFAIAIAIVMALFVKPIKRMLEEKD